MRGQSKVIYWLIDSKLKLTSLSVHRMIKKMTDEILDNPKERDASKKSQDEVSACKYPLHKLNFKHRDCIWNTLTVIQNSGSHMEHTILASVTSILIGFVVTNNPNNEQVVRRYLRDGKFTGMVGTLMQYYEFLNLTVSVSNKKILKFLRLSNDFFLFL